MFTTAKHTAQSVKQQAAALGLAAAVTLSMLGGVDLLAAAQSPDSLLAAGAAPIALSKVAVKG